MTIKFYENSEQIFKNMKPGESATGVIHRTDGTIYLGTLKENKGAGCLKGSGFRALIENRELAKNAIIKAYGTSTSTTKFQIGAGTYEPMTHLNIDSETIKFPGLKFLKNYFLSKNNNVPFPEEETKQKMDKEYTDKTEMNKNLNQIKAEAEKVKNFYIENSYDENYKAFTSHIQLFDILRQENQPGTKDEKNFGGFTIRYLKDNKYEISRTSRSLNHDDKDEKVQVKGSVPNLLLDNSLAEKIKDLLNNKKLNDNPVSIKG